MADDNFRPTHGPSPDQRSTDAPGWWPSLAREDLPEGGVTTGGTTTGGAATGGAAAADTESGAERALRGRPWPRLLAAVTWIVRRGGH